MNRFILANLVMLATLFMFSGVAQAQVSASISPNNITNGETITVTLTGLEPNTTYTVKLLGVGENPYGIKSNTERQVTTNANGVASWNETISWGANTYATSVEYTPPGGHTGAEAGGTLHVGS
ncbi:MAG: hypothetical protein IT458_14705 [Planctomycetes bacterium]|nr:hypothetical protein [Planctomycetota bacterium]